jgi:CelD/BcsL family acetyltransferase involved in cellulose biosynthesis
LDGRPAAAEYHFAGGGVVYVYQGGVEPELLRAEPGSLAKVCLIKQAIAEGYREIDFLRGDEPYKPHWRAEPRACIDIRIVPRRLSSRLRNRAWLAGRSVKRWLTRKQENGIRRQQAECNH